MTQYYAGTRRNGTIGNRRDPYLSYRFKVIIEGVVVGSFTDVSGLNIETTVEKKVFGGDNQMEHVFFNFTKYNDITLKRGITDSYFWDWYKKVISGVFLRRSGSICLMDDRGNPQLWWDFFDACPVKWEGPTFNASSNAIAAESIVLINNGIKMHS